MRGLVRIAAVGSLVALLLPLLEPVWWVLGLAVHFPLQIAAFSLLALAFALGLRERVAALALVLALTGAIWQMRDHLPRFATAEAAGVDLVVVAMNLEWRNRQWERAVEYLEGLRADVVVLPEYTPDTAANFTALAAIYPHRLEAPRDGAFGIGLLSRHPISSGQIRFPADVDNPFLDAVIEAYGRQIRVIGVHARPPISRRYIMERDAQTQAIAELLRTETRTVLVVGDFNDTPFSASFRSFLSRSGLRNAAERRGYVGTFPATRLPLWIPIDHCLYRGRLQPLRVRPGPDIGADHFPLVAEFSL